MDELRREGTRQARPPTRRWLSVPTGGTQPDTTSPQGMADLIGLDRITRDPAVHQLSYTGMRARCCPSPLPMA